jgi:DnaJ-class molecular chaperone
VIGKFGKKPAALVCFDCCGAGRRVVRTAVVGKGWVTKGLRCETCKGRGSLRTR